MHLALLLIMILSFNINVLNFIWHGFHFPNQLPYRNSFVYIFLILSMAYPALRSLGEFQRPANRGDRHGRCRLCFAGSKA
jgi:uncharacterized membrane protein YfhO